MKIMTTRTMTYAAFLTVLSIILTRFISLTLPFFGFPSFSIELGGVPIIAGGILFGPIVGGIIGFVTDIVGFLINQRGGAYFPGFTLNSVLTGVIPGVAMMLLQKEFFKKRDIFWYVISLLIVIDIIGSVYLTSLNELVLKSSVIEITVLMKVIGLILLNASTLVCLISLILVRKKYRLKPSLMHIDKIVFIVLLVELFVYIALTPLWLDILYGIPPFPNQFMRVIRASIIVSYKSIFIYFLLRIAHRFVRKEVA